MGFVFICILTTGVLFSRFSSSFQLMLPPKCKSLFSTVLISKFYVFELA